MKLIVCIKCSDVVRLSDKSRECECGLSSGHYVDDLVAEISGPCLPIGFANESFMEAIANQPKNGVGKRFDAFIIQQECETVKRIGPAPKIPPWKSRQQALFEAIMEISQPPKPVKVKPKKRKRA